MCPCNGCNYWLCVCVCVVTWSGPTGVNLFGTCCSEQALTCLRPSVMIVKLNKQLFCILSFSKSSVWASCIQLNVAQLCSVCVNKSTNLSVSHICYDYVISYLFFLSKCANFVTISGYGGGGGGGGVSVTHPIPRWDVWIRVGRKQGAAVAIYLCPLLRHTSRSVTLVLSPVWPATQPCQTSRKCWPLFGIRGKPRIYVFGCPESRAFKMYQRQM